MLVVDVLRWCTERLSKIWSDSTRAFPDLVIAPRPQIEAALKLLDIEPVASAVGGVPVRSDLVAIRREGAPWGAVADVAQEFLEAEKSIDHLVYQVLMPDEVIRWRLFHLAVLGTLLAALRSHGCFVQSTRPLSARSSGPNYHVVSPTGEEYDLWFEASGVWGHLGRPAPFVEATSGMRDVRRANGADILLLAKDKKALILECKYSGNQDVVARDGYYQATAYAAEARSRLAGDVLSIAIGPETTVPKRSFTHLSIGTVGTAPPSFLHELIPRFLITDFHAQLMTR
jgi:hypothetical protein